jgi:hypothetical protein
VGLITIVFQRDVYARANTEKNFAQKYVTPGCDEGQIACLDVLSRNAFLYIYSTKHIIVFRVSRLKHRSHRLLLYGKIYNVFVFLTILRINSGLGSRGLADWSLQT